jgi:hypothetical protein
LRLKAEEAERIAATLRHSQHAFCHHMHGRVDRCLTGALDVAGERIEVGEVVVIGSGVGFLAQ